VKKTELAQKISQVKEGVTELTSNIESMRSKRDATLADIDRYERETNVSTQDGDFSPFNFLQNF
jgi:uncharacterized coiled-coil DUF342 family protein